MLYTLNLHRVICQRYHNKVNKSIRAVGVGRNEKKDEVRVLEYSIKFGGQKDNFTKDIEKEYEGN